jgi:hypothetical protein
MAISVGPTFQMKISLWYHAMFINGQVPKDLRFSQKPMEEEWSISLMLDQMDTIKKSGLLDAAQELVVCVNGDAINQTIARAAAPPKARFIDHGPNAQSLLLTVHALRQWAIEHKDWFVCFFHMKGVTHPQEPLDFAWRKCMEHWTLREWRRCVADLESGCDSVGTHWLTPEQYGPVTVPVPIWGGMFWWARASFLADLPQLPLAPRNADDWWLPERWIGLGRRPIVRDYAPHWPSLNDCGPACRMEESL